MKKQYFLLLNFLFGLLASCATNRTLVEKENSDKGIIKFYIEKDFKESPNEKRLLAAVDNSLYYTFYSDKIVKQTREHKGLIYTLYFDKLPDKYDSKSFEQLSPTDSIVLSKGNEILDSLGWADYLKSSGASAFLIEVNYYHDYPQNKRFKP